MPDPITPTQQVPGASSGAGTTSAGEQSGGVQAPGVTSGTPIPSSQPSPAGAPTAPVTTPAPPAQGAGAGTSAAGATGTGQPGTAGTASPAGPVSFRDMAKQMGFEVGQQFPDDQAFARHLLERQQQAAELDRFRQQVVPHWSQFQEFLAEKQRAAQQQQAQQQQGPWWKQFWNPPEYDPAWEQQITRDAQGNLVPAQGAPPDVVNKYLTYRQFRAAQAERLMSNPYQFIEEPVKMLAAQVAQQIVQQQLGGYQDQIFARGWAEQNSGWLYEREPSGAIKQQAVVDPATGQARSEPMLSIWGQRFRAYVIQAEQMGIRGVREQSEYATGLVQRDYLAQQNGTNGATLAQQQANQQFLQQAAGHNPSAAGALSSPPSGVVNGSPNGIVANTAASLAQRLRADLAQAGVSDRDFAASR